MSAIPNSAASESVDRGSQAGRTHLEQLLARGCSDPREVRDSVHALSDAGLMAFGLRAFHMNLLSLFGETWSRERIATTARAAAISKILGGWEYHHHYLPGLTATADGPQLGDLPFGLIEELLARGRGLVILTFHLGHMRYLPSDLAHAGIPICAPLARDSFGDYRTARLANPDAALWTGFRFVNVEDRGGTLALARTLAGGGCVISTIDGNTGLDGPRGDQRRATVRVLNSAARVKTGLLAIAARFGCPILPMIAHTSGDRRLCRTAPVIDPGRALSGEEGERFVETAAQSAYSFLGAALLEHAGEWCGGDLFHQWRVPCALPERDLVAVEHELAQSLEAGGRVTVNHRRILPLSDDGDVIWSDAVSGSCYKLPAQMAELTRQLSTQGGGVDLAWLGRYSGPERARMWMFLCQLASRDAIRAVERTDRAQSRQNSKQALQEIVRPLMHGASDTHGKEVHQPLGWN